MAFRVRLQSRRKPDVADLDGAVCRIDFEKGCLTTGLAAGMVTDGKKDGFETGRLLAQSRAIAFDIRPGAVAKVVPDMPGLIPLMAGFIELFSMTGRVLRLQSDPFAWQRIAWRNQRGRQGGERVTGQGTPIKILIFWKGSHDAYPCWA